MWLTGCLTGWWKWSPSLPNLLEQPKWPRHLQLYATDIHRHTHHTMECATLITLHFSLCLSDITGPPQKQSRWGQPPTSSPHRCARRLYYTCIMLWYLSYSKESSTEKHRWAFRGQVKAQLPPTWINSRVWVCVCVCIRRHTDRCLSPPPQSGADWSLRLAFEWLCQRPPAAFWVSSAGQGQLWCQGESIRVWHGHLFRFIVVGNDEKK